MKEFLEHYIEAPIQNEHYTSGGGGGGGGGGGAQEAPPATEPTPQELDAKIEDMIERGTFLESIWFNGDSLLESTVLTVPYAYSVASGWRTIRYKQWYLRDHAPEGRRDHADADEMHLAIFRSSVMEGDFKLHSEGSPKPDSFEISEL